MYLAYWGMTRPPFEEGLSPTGAIMSSGTKLSLTKIRWALHSGWQVIWVTGAEGVGKTVVCRIALAQAAQDGWATACLDNPLLPLLENLAHLQRQLCSRLPIGEDFESSLAEALKNGNRICVAIDDVQAQKGKDILEYLRRALRLGEGGQARLQVLLCGQEGGEEMLRQASGLLSHVSLRVIVHPLALPETKRYILLRLKHAGCTRGIFTRQAAEKIYEATQGIPRHINRVCALALLLGYALKLKKLGVDTVLQAAANLGLGALAVQQPPAFMACLLYTSPSPRDS